jgi:hypothetical protein
VLVRTSSLFDGWSGCNGEPRRFGNYNKVLLGCKNVHETTMTRVLRVHPSEAQAKLPESRRSARYLWLPPRVRTTWMRLGPIRVFAGWRPASKALFFPVRAVRNNDSFLIVRVTGRNAWGQFLRQSIALS